MLQRELKATAGTRLESEDMYLQTHIDCVYTHAACAGVIDRGSSSCAGTVCLLSPAAEILVEILLLLPCFLKQPN